MSIVRTSIAAIAFAALTTFTAQAQGARPAAPPAMPAGGTATQPVAGGGAVKIAIIDPAAFTDDKEGITRVINAAKILETQFQPQRTELQGMQDRLTTMRADIQKKKDVQKPEITAQQIDQADQLEVQLKRKLEDVQGVYLRKRAEVLGPLQSDVYGALQAFAQARGIALIIDMSAFADPNDPNDRRPPNPLLYAAASVDITKDFITEYNRTHPATAAAAPAATPGRP